MADFPAEQSRPRAELPLTPGSFPTLPILSSRLDPKRLRRAQLLALLLVLLAACLLAVGATAASQRQPQHPSPAKLKPKPKPAYWGAWIGDQITGTGAPWDMNAVAYFEQMLGKGMSLIEFSSPWRDCTRIPCQPYEFPDEAMDNVRGHGSIPLFSWGSEAAPSTGPEQPDFQLAKIASGAFDPYIAQFATEAREWGHPFFLRFDWEMNGNWFPWSQLANGNEAGQFVAAWRHVHDIFSAVGATNATWVWCPYADTAKRLKKNPLKPLYPGDAYVDWTCLDAYNWGLNAVNPRPWRSFRELFDPAYTQLVKKVAPRKPMLLGEFATSPNGGHKATWIRKMFTELPRRYPRIRALVYFNTVDRGVDWPLETSLPAARAFAAGIRKNTFASNRFGTLPGGPILPLR
jgi:mannan endo-1,4-beta-mannosidase